MPNQGFGWQASIKAGAKENPRLDHPRPSPGRPFEVSPAQNMTMQMWDTFSGIRPIINYKAETGAIQTFLLRNFGGL